jgi:hypothetical protein
MSGRSPALSALERFNLDDHDSGAPPSSIQSSPNFGPMTTAIHNISSRHLHDISTTLPDERQFLRHWRRQLQECIGGQSARLIRFLVDASGTDISGSEIARRCQDVLAKYSRPTWSFTSSTRDLALSTNTVDATMDLEGLIGVAPTTFREYQKRVIRLYVDSAAALSAAESRLEEKLKRLETVVGRMNDLMFLEPTAALEDMAAPTRAYLDSVLDKVDLQTDYTDLVTTFKRFSVLKGLVSLQNFQRVGTAPTCTICMVREVNQAVTPCGHTFCDECCRSQMTLCYICRVQIRDKIRLYFS